MSHPLCLLLPSTQRYDCAKPVKRVRRAMAIALVFGGWSALAHHQGISIKHTKNKDITPAVEIYVNNSCKEGRDALCAATNAADIATDINEIHAIHGPPIGLDDSILVYVFDQGYGSAGGYSPEQKAIRLPSDWMENSPTGVLHHETGHAIVDEHVGVQHCDGSSCVRSIVEHWGVDEGIATIMEVHVGEGKAGTPPADSVDGIFAHSECNMRAPAGGGQECAHELGELLLQTFNKLMLAKGKNEALSIYLQALREYPYGTMDFNSYLYRVGRVIMDRENVNFAEPPGLSDLLGDASFRLRSWTDFIDWLYSLPHIDIRPHEAPR